MKKDIALLIVIILAAAAVIKGVDIQSVDEYYSLHSGICGIVAVQACTATIPQMPLTLSL